MPKDALHGDFYYETFTMLYSAHSYHVLYITHTHSSSHNKCGLLLIVTTHSFFVCNHMRNDYSDSSLVYTTGRVFTPPNQQFHTHCCYQSSPAVMLWHTLLREDSYSFSPTKSVFLIYTLLTEHRMFLTIFRPLKLY